MYPTVPVTVNCMASTGRMVIHNDSHMHWTFVLTDNTTDSGATVDSMWMIKTRPHY